MAKHTLPGLGLTGAFSDSEDGWGDDMNANLLKMSSIGGGTVKGRVAAVPDAPAAGDIYILTTDDTVAVYDTAWTYYVPVEGWLFFDRDANVFVNYDGTDWVVLETGGAGEGLADAPSDGKLYARQDGAWVEVVSSGGGDGGDGGGVGGTPWAVIFKPRDNEPPAANYARHEVRNARPLLSFDADTQQAAIFTGTIPVGYAGGTLTVDLFTATVAVAGTLGWDVAVERSQQTVTVIDNDAFAAPVAIAPAAVPATSMVVNKMSVDLPPASLAGLVGGDMFRLRVRRDAVNDTAAGLAYLAGVAVREK